VSAENEARGKGDDHERDVVELARKIGTAVEDDRGGKQEQAKRECDTRLDQTHAPTTGRAKSENYPSSPTGPISVRLADRPSEAL
jgi:hypothetical protein